MDALDEDRTLLSLRPIGGVQYPNESLITLGVIVIVFPLLVSPKPDPGRQQQP